jgi:4a-hydroxytetrahydrobiopterin dehydratase
MPTPLADDQITAALNNLPGWSLHDGKLHKRFEFGSHGEAVSFIVRIGFAAEAMGHHPETRNVYATVELSLCTHDAGGAVTQKDLDLAREVERINWLSA